MEVTVSGDKVCKTKGMRAQSSCCELSLLIFATKHIHVNEYIYVLGWQKSSSRFFHKMVRKNPNKIFLANMCCCPVAKSCLTLCSPKDCRIPGSSVLHYLPVCSNSCPLSQRCFLTISSSAALFLFCFQSFPASESFPMSQLFTSGGQSTGASASVLPMHIQG